MMLYNLLVQSKEFSAPNLSHKFHKKKFWKIVIKITTFKSEAKDTEKLV